MITIVEGVKIFYSLKEYSEYRNEKYKGIKSDKPVFDLSKVKGLPFTERGNY